MTFSNENLSVKLLRGSPEIRSIFQLQQNMFLSPLAELHVLSSTYNCGHEHCSKV